MTQKGSTTIFVNVCEQARFYGSCQFGTRERQPQPKDGQLVYTSKADQSVDATQSGFLMTRPNITVNVQTHAMDTR